MVVVLVHSTLIWPFWFLELVHLHHRLRYQKATFPRLAALFWRNSGWGLSRDISPVFPAVPLWLSGFAACFLVVSNATNLLLMRVLLYHRGRPASPWKGTWWRGMSRGSKSFALFWFFFENWSCLVDSLIDLRFLPFPCSHLRCPQHPSLISPKFLACP